MSYDRWKECGKGLQSTWKKTMTEARNAKFLMQMRMLIDPEKW